jgi:hypothetical protein
LKSSTSQISGVGEAKAFQEGARARSVRVVMNRGEMDDFKSIQKV